MYPTSSALALLAGLALGVAAGVAPRAALAGPADYIFSPRVEQGDREIDSKAGMARDRHGHSYWAASLGIEYGFTDRWSSELTLNLGRPLGEPTEVDSIEWENRFQLTTHEAARPYVLGFLFEVERARERAEGWELRAGPLLEGYWGEAQVNLNLLFERRVDADERAPTQFGYQWQWRPHREAALDVGLQGFGHLGRWDHWAPHDGQSHILGPTLFATLGDDEESPEIEIGLLFGTGGLAPRQTLRLQAMVPF